MKNGIIEYGPNAYSLFIYPDYRCLGNCLFCYLDEKMVRKKASMTFNELKDNIIFFTRKYLIRDIVVMGGEPLLWPEIISFLDFVASDFSVSRPLNLIVSTEALQTPFKGLLASLKKISSKKLTRLYLQIPINHYSFENRSKIRRDVFLNLARNKFRVRYIIFFTKENMDILEKEINFLLCVFDEYYSTTDVKKFCLELRLPFGRYPMKFLAKPDDFFRFFHKISEMLIRRKIAILLRHIPFCYLKDKKSGFFEDYIFKSKSSQTVFKIDKNHQKEKAIKTDYKTSFCSNFPECSRCLLRKNCGGINPIYVNLGYPRPKPFVK